MNEGPTEERESASEENEEANEKGEGDELFSFGDLVSDILGGGIGRGDGEADC